MAGWLNSRVFGASLAIGVIAAAVIRPDLLPWLVLLGWARAPVALGLASARSRGTELRGALLWAWLALGLGAISQALALGEPIATGRPWAGHACYLATLSALAGLITVLNARTPGGGAWAILMGLLVVVFLIPWLEGTGLRGGASPLGRLQLESPWDLFFGLLVLAGTTNFLPTRFGWAAFWLLVGFVSLYVGLSGWLPSREWRGICWSLVPWAISEAFPAAARGEARRPPSVSPLERLWFWFRDHWGVVWGLRIMERFNRTAESQGWGFRLTWQGLRRREGDDGASDEAGLVLLKGLLRRFAATERLDEAAEAGN